MKKIIVLLIGLILLSGCTNNICKLTNGNDYVWKIGWDGGCRKIEQENQTNLYALGEPLFINRSLVTMRFTLINYTTLIEKKSEEDFIRVNCDNFNEEMGLRKELPVETKLIILNSWKLCKYFEVKA